LRFWYDDNDDDNDEGGGCGGCGGGGGGGGGDEEREITISPKIVPPEYPKSHIATEQSQDPASRSSAATAHRGERGEAAHQC
jgi:hypothetical protein